MSENDCGRATTPNDIDLMRLALRNPKKFLELSHLANPRQALDFIYRRFAYCPLFYFDKALSAQAVKLGADYPDVMGRLMPDVRLPFANMITVHTEPADEKLAISLLWESETIIRSQPLLHAVVNGVESGHLSTAPFSYIISPDGEDRIRTSTEFYYGSLTASSVPSSTKPSNSDSR